MVRKPAGRRGAAAPAVPAVLVLAAWAAPAVGAPDTARADDARTVSCTYVVEAAWNGGFTADLKIADNGPDVNGWTVRWTFPDPATRVLGSWSTVLTETGDGAVTAANAPYDAVIRSGQALTFGWTARGASAAPAAFTVNGVAC